MATRFVITGRLARNPELAKAIPVSSYYRTGADGAPEFVHQYAAEREPAKPDVAQPHFTAPSTPPEEFRGQGQEASAPAYSPVGGDFNSWFAGSHAAYPSGIPKPLYAVADEPGVFTESEQAAQEGPQNDPQGTVPQQMRYHVLQAASEASGRPVDPEAARLFTQSGDLQMLHPQDPSSPVWQAMVESAGGSSGPVYVSIKNPLYADRRLDRESLAGMAAQDPPLLHSIARSVMDRTGAGHSEWPQFTRGSDVVEALNRMGRDTDLPDVLQRAGYDGMIHPLDENDEVRHYHIVNPDQVLPIVAPAGPTQGVQSAKGIYPQYHPYQELFDTTIAKAQRGDPENAMLNLQHVNSGGVLNLVAEHIGDLSHRMTEDTTARNGGYEFVKPKVERMLKIMTNPYGFGKEMYENIRSNAPYLKTTYEDLRSKVHQAMSDYADAHSRLPVYNEVQKLARDSAIHLGNKEPGKVIDNLYQLRKYLDEGEEAWANRAHEYDPQIAHEDTMSRLAKEG